MTEDQDAKDSQSDSGSKTFTNKNKDKKVKSQRPLTKVSILQSGTVIFGERGGVDNLFGCFR